jgi:hypothetical protein
MVPKAFKGGVGIVLWFCRQILFIKSYYSALVTFSCGLCIVVQGRGYILYFVLHIYTIYSM